MDPKCNHPGGEYIVGNYWQCKICDAPKVSASIQDLVDMEGMTTFYMPPTFFGPNVVGGVIEYYTQSTRLDTVPWLVKTKEVLVNGFGSVGGPYVKIKSGSKVVRKTEEETVTVYRGPSPNTTDSTSRGEHFSLISSSGWDVAWTAPASEVVSNNKFTVTFKSGTILTKVQPTNVTTAQVSNLVTIYRDIGHKSPATVLVGTAYFRRKKDTTRIQEPWTAPSNAIHNTTADFLQFKAGTILTRVQSSTQQLKSSVHHTSIATTVTIYRGVVAPKAT